MPLLDGQPVPAYDDPQWREKMAEYHRNLKLHQLPQELGRMGQQFNQQMVDPRQLKSSGLALAPAWINLMNELLQQGMRKTMGVKE